VKLSLSTNWCNRRIEAGEAIAELAASMGFDELELGYSTTAAQAAGFKRRLDLIPVGSVHAFVPVPISAPCGYPELYQLASFDEETRKMAHLQIVRTVNFAAEMGADTVVLHAGRVPFGSFFHRLGSGVLTRALTKAEKKIENKRYQKMLTRSRKVRTARGVKMLEIERGELERLVPELEKGRVTLALENMPYYEGFPIASEMDTILGWGLGDFVKAWYDTGHARVCACHGWTDAIGAEWLAAHAESVAGMHLNDVEDLSDDHLAPGDGKVDFAALAPVMPRLRHVVFEPHSGVEEQSLRRGLERIRTILCEPSGAPDGLSGNVV